VKVEEDANSDNEEEKEEEKPKKVKGKASPIVQYNLRSSSKAKNERVIKGPS